MKSYTDLEQSKKLAEILSLQSADMCYVRAYFEGKQSDWFVNLGKPIKSDDVIPCWSLTALLAVIPKPDLVQNSEGTWLLHSWVNDYPWSVGGYSNPVDACVAMIEKLHEQKFL